MQEPYKSCWECEHCDDLRQHITNCIPLDDSMEVNNAIIGMKLFEEKNRAKLKR